MLKWQVSVTRLALGTGVSTYQVHGTGGSKGSSRHMLIWRPTGLPSNASPFLKHLDPGTLQEPFRTPGCWSLALPSGQAERRRVSRGEHSQPMGQPVGGGCQLRIGAAEEPALLHMQKVPGSTPAAPPDQGGRRPLV